MDSSHDSGKDTPNSIKIGPAVAKLWRFVYRNFRVQCPIFHFWASMTGSMSATVQVHCKENGRYFAIFSGTNKQIQMKFHTIREKHVLNKMDVF